MAEITLFRNYPGRVVPAVSSTSSRVCGTYFNINRDVWLKAIRIYRQNTTLYGTLEACIYRYKYNTDSYEYEVGTYGTITLANGSGPTGWVEIVFPTPIKLDYSYQQGGSFQVAVRFPGGAGNKVPFEADWWTNRADRVRDSGHPDYGKTVGGLALGAMDEEKSYSGPGSAFLPTRGQSAYVYSNTLIHPGIAADGDHGLDVRVDELNPADPPTGPPIYRTQPYSGLATYPSSGYNTATIQGSDGPYQEIRGTIIGYDFEVTSPAWVVTMRIYAASTAGGIGGTYLRIYERQDNGTTWLPLNGTTIKINDNNSVPSPGFGGWKEVSTTGFPALVVGRRYRIMVSTDTYHYLPNGAVARTVGPIKILPGAYYKAPASGPGNLGDVSLPTTATTQFPLIDFYATIQDPYANPEGGGFGDPAEPNETAQRLWGVTPPYGYDIKPGSFVATQEFEVTLPVRAHGIRFYRPTLEGVKGTGIYMLAVRSPIIGYIPMPGTAYRFSLANHFRTGWVYCAFRHPAKLAPNTRYVVLVQFDDGYIETSDYFTTGPGATTSAVSRGRLRFVEQEVATLRKPYNNWVDVTVTPWTGTTTGAKGTFAEPAGAIRLWGTGRPGHANPTNPGAVTVIPNFWRTSTYVTSMQFSVTEDCTGHGVRFYRATGPNGMVRGRPVARLYEFHGAASSAWEGTEWHTNSGSEVIGADVTFDDGTSEGWVYAAFRAPILLKTGKNYVLMMFFPNGMPFGTYQGYYDSTEFNTIKDADGETAALQWAQDKIAAAGPIVSGPIVVPAPANSSGHSPFRFHFGGVLSDSIAWPSTASEITSYIDITVTTGTTGAIDKQERSDSLNSRGILRPPPSEYGDISLGDKPDTAGHDIAFDTNVTVYGMRWYCPDLRYITGQVAIYQAATATMVSGTLTTMNPVTGFLNGWVYIPFTNPVVLTGNVKYRLVMTAPGGLAGVPVGRAKVLQTGRYADISSWNGEYNPNMHFPDGPDLNDYMLDLSYSVGGDPNAGQVVKTLFDDDLVQRLVEDYASYLPKLQVFNFLHGLGRNAGIRFGVNEVTYCIGMRLLRISLDVDGPILGRIYQVYNDPNDNHPVPDRGTKGRIVSGSEIVIDIDPDDMTLGWVTGMFSLPVRLEPGYLYCAVLWIPHGLLIGEGWFLPGNPGDSGTAPRMGPKGTLYYGGTDWAPNNAQGVSKASNKPEYPWIGNFQEDTDPTNPARRPAGHNYFVDVLCVDKPPDYLPMKLPRQPLSYSIYGRFPMLSDPPVARSIMAGLEFYVIKTAYVSAYRFPRTDPAIQSRPVIAGLYEMTGENTGTPIPESFGIINLIPAVWQSAHLAPAIKVVPGKRYKLVMQFLGGHPNMEYFRWENVEYEPWGNDMIRGPLVVPSDANALGQATSTWAPANAFIYPIYPSTGEGSGIGHYLDLLVSEVDPNTEFSEVEFSLYEQRLPPFLSQQALLKGFDTSGIALHEYRNAGTEMYFTQAEVYVTQIHYWRSAFPTSTVIQSIAIYEVTDAYSGIEVPGTRVTLPNWPDAPGGGGAAWAEGWVTHNLPTPVKLYGSRRYRIGAYYPFRNEQQSVPLTIDYWSSGYGGSGVFSGPVVAPNREQSLGQLQGPETSYLAYDGQEYGPEYPGAMADQYGAPYSTKQYWVDVTVLDTAPRTVDGGMVTKALSVGRRERRSSGVEATDAPVNQLAIEGRASGAKEVGSEPVAELEVLATPFSGQALIQQTVGVQAEALAINKFVIGGTVDSESALQTKQFRARKTTGDDSTAEMNVYGTAYESFRWAPIPREAQSFPFTYNPQHIRFIAQNIMTRQFLHMDLPIVNPQITWRLSGPFELTGTISPAYNDILDIMMDEWSTFIHVEYQGQIMGTGILMPWSADEHTLNIEAIGITTYPHGIPYMDHFHKFFPDVMEVVREMWRHIQSFPNGNMGVLLPTGTMGVPLFGKVHHDDAGNLLGWEEWNLHWTDFTDCGSFIDNLAVSTPFDYAEVHAWNASHTDILHGINFGYPRMGGKRDGLKFEQGANIVDSISITEPEDAYVSDVIIKGAGEGPDQIYTWCGATFWDRLRRVIVITDEQISDHQMAFGIANQELVRRLYARGLEKVVVEAFHLYAPLGSYFVGDDILIDAMIPFVGEFLLWHRITAIEYVRDTGLVTLQVARSESFRYGRPRPAGT